MDTSTDTGKAKYEELSKQAAQGPDASKAGAGGNPYGAGYPGSGQAKSK